MKEVQGGYIDLKIRFMVKEAVAIRELARKKRLSQRKLILRALIDQIGKVYEGE
jgi:hypothetical protein